MLAALGLVKAVLGSAAIAGTGVPEIVSALLDAVEGRHPAVVTAEVDDPIRLVERMLAMPDKPQVLFGLLFAQRIDSYEVSE